MIAEIKKECVDVYRFRYVVYSYVQTYLKLRYRRSYLGFVWTVLAPMLHYVVIGVVFSLLMRGSQENYFLYYFSGAVFFGIVAGTFSRGMMAFIANEQFIKKIYIPKMIYILQAVSVEFTNFFLSTLALMAIGLVTGHLHLSPSLFLTLIPLALLFFTLVGVACLVAVMTVYFRDFTNIIPAALQALFFATPILYDPSMMPERYHWVFKANPLYYFLELIRQPLLNSSFAPLRYYVFCTAVAALTFVFGLLTVKAFDNKIVFRL